MPLVYIHAHIIASRPVFIDEADVFVGDVSIINQETRPVRRMIQRAFRLPTRRTPNPNVLVEVGYAIKTMGSTRIILVLNSFFGGPELLPFDLRMKRTLAFNMPPSSAERASERNRLATALEQALRGVFTNVDTILPELSIEDNLIFKTICEMVVDTQQDSFGRNTLEEMAPRFVDGFDESLRILK